MYIHSVNSPGQKRQTRWLASLAFDLPQPLSLTARCVGSVHVAPGQLIPASAAATGQLQALLAERDATLEAECTLGVGAASERYAPAVSTINDNHGAPRELCYFVFICAAAATLEAGRDGRILHVHLHLRRGRLELHLCPGNADCALAICHIIWLLPIDLVPFLAGSVRTGGGYVTV